MSDRIRLAVIFGGDSSEHGVSCLTAAGALGALDTQRYDITCIGITGSGTWTLVDRDEVASLATTDGKLPQVPDDGQQAVLVRTATSAAFVARDGDRLGAEHPVDVALLLLHGPFGEDGTVQGMLELYGVRYVGSGVLASAVGLDKGWMKACFAAAGLPQGPYRVITGHDWDYDRQLSLQKLAELEYPLFVKPSRAGSSVGITRVAAPEQLEGAIEQARKHDPKVIVEQGIVGREIECAVLGSHAGQQPRTSLLGEITMIDPDTFYDFDAKYLPEEQVRLDIPAKVDPALEQRVQELARRAFVALEAEGLSRVDFFVTPDDQVLINEINTLPGFTAFSMYPMLWQASGMSYPALLDELIDLALERPVGLR